MTSFEPPPRPEPPASPEQPEPVRWEEEDALFLSPDGGGEQPQAADLYARLGVKEGATSEQIQAAYEAASSACRLRYGPGSRELAQLDEAYEVLRDPARRAAYDKERRRAEREREIERLRHSKNPIVRLTAPLPRGLRVTIDWVVTIVGAIAIVLAIKAWVVNPYRIPSSSMEPTLHCARPGSGCEARFSDRVLANRFIYHFREPARGDIVVFTTPPSAEQKCGAAGTFVKRLIALPGETWEQRDGFVYINGRRLVEPYVTPDRRDQSTYPPRKIPEGRYFFMGDNRSQSCDSREWGAVPRKDIIGEVFFVYWPPNRIGFRAALVLLGFVVVPLAAGRLGSRRV